VPQVPGNLKRPFGGITPLERCILDYRFLWVLAARERVAAIARVTGWLVGARIGHI